MTFDHPRQPTQATCDHPGCPNIYPNPEGFRRRRLERQIVRDGWTWLVDYAQVLTYCTTHAEVPVVQSRAGGKRRPPPPEPAP